MHLMQLELISTRYIDVTVKNKEMAVSTLSFRSCRVSNSFGSYVDL